MPLNFTFRRSMLLAFVAVALPLAASAPAGAQVVLYPQPAGLTASTLHSVKINGQDAFVYAIKVNPTPNYQDIQTPASMLPFGLHGGSANVEITMPAGTNLTDVVVRAQSRDIIPTIVGNKVSFTLTEPGNFSVEFNNSRDKPLFLFANPPEVNPPTQGGANVIYYGPGVHNAGKITLQSNQTLYLAPGAFVNGYVYSANAQNIRIEGRGILHGGDYAKDELGQKFVEVRDSRYVTLQGVILLDSPEWNIHPHNSRDVLIDNVKVIGWRRNSDAIDPTNARNLTIRDVFLKGQDDGITLKGRIIPSQPTIQNVTVEGATIWNNWMRPLVVGGELADITLIRNIRFRDIDIIYSGHNPASPENRDAAMSVWNMDNATVEDVVFENIRVEHADRLIRLNISKNQFSQTVDYGHVRDITFKDIKAGTGVNAIEITGYSRDHMIRDITIENLSIGGNVIRRPDEAVYLANAFVRNVHFVSDTGTVTAIYTDPFAQNMDGDFNVSAGRVGLQWRDDRNGVRTPLVNGSTVATPGRYDSAGNMQGAAMTWKESIGRFGDYETFEVSAQFVYVDANNTNVNLAGVGISDRDNGVLATGATAAGRRAFDIVLRSDANTSGKNAVLQLTSVRADGTTDQARENTQQVTLVGNTWYQLVASITRKGGGLFDVFAELFDRGGSGLASPTLLLSQQLLDVSNPGLLDSTDLFAGLGMYARSATEHGMQAVDQFHVLGINPIPEPATLALLALAAPLLLRRR